MVKLYPSNLTTSEYVPSLIANPSSAVIDPTTIPFAFMGNAFVPQPDYTVAYCATATILFTLQSGNAHCAPSDASAPQSAASIPRSAFTAAEFTLSATSATSTVQAAAFVDQ